MDLGIQQQEEAKAALCSHPPARAFSTIRPDRFCSESLHGQTVWSHSYMRLHE